MNFASIAKSIGMTLKDHSPQILTGLGALGVVTTTVMAVKATPSALEEIKNEEARRSVDRPNYILNPKEKVAVAWKHYIPATSMGLATISCIIGANSINLRRNAALISAYSITEKAFSDYKHKVIETMGEDRDYQIRQEITNDRMHEANNTRSLVLTGTENFLCYDSYCDRWFESTLEKIRKAQNDVNYDILNDGYASLNDFYRLVGLEPNKIGEEVGWRSDLLMDLDFEPKITAEGKPAIAMVFKNEPNREYYNKF